MKHNNLSNLIGWKHFRHAMSWSIRGLVSTYKGESAFRQELFLATIFIPVGLWLGATGVEKALLVGSIILVLIIELLNTAIESVVDRIGSEFHELSARAKDIGSSAVFLTLIFTATIWLLVLWPYIR